LKVLEWTASKTSKTPAAILGLGVGAALAYIGGEIYLHNNPVADIPISDDTDGGDFGAFERTSAAGPALSANGTRVRGLLKISELNDTNSDNYMVGHHLITFAELNKRSPAFLQAVIASGFELDSIDNLIALPGNRQTFERMGEVLPYHAGSHGQYSAVVGTNLDVLESGYRTMTPAQLKAGLYGVSKIMQLQIYARDWHDRVR
jgi:hypothetical protein